MKKAQPSVHPKWEHPGGKLIEEGADKLTDAELLAILIGTGTKGKSAEQLANDIIQKFRSYRGIANQPFERFYEFKGIGEVKMVRIAAAFEIARRIVNDVLTSQHEKA